MYKVLVVDDEKMIKLSFKKLINWEKYNLTLVNDCSNGEEALEYIINNPVDILITDIKMPIMDGVTLLKELKTRGITPLATIVLSAFNEYDLIRTSFKLNIDDYILKNNYDEDSIVELILNIINKKTPKNIEVVPKCTSEITQVINFLKNNYHKNICLKSISDHVCYSESYLSYLFSKEIGVTVIYYLNKLRVEKAKELLHDSNLKVYEISSKVGFQSVEHFSRSFKKLTSTSPKQFKNHLHN